MKTVSYFLSFVLLLNSNVFAARVKCADFKTQKQAQAYYNAKKPGYKNLDRDKDGEACECLPGGSKHGSSVCRR